MSAAITCDDEKSTHESADYRLFSPLELTSHRRCSPTRIGRTLARRWLMGQAYHVSEWLGFVLGRGIGDVRLGRTAVHGSKGRRIISFVEELWRVLTVSRHDHSRQDGDLQTGRGTSLWAGRVRDEQGSRTHCLLARSCSHRY